MVKGVWERDVSKDPGRWGGRVRERGGCHVPGDLHAVLSLCGTCQNITLEICCLDFKSCAWCISLVFCCGGLRICEVLRRKRRNKVQKTQTQRLGLSFFGPVLDLFKISRTLFFMVLKTFFFFSSFRLMHLPSTKQLCIHSGDSLDIQTQI